VRRCGFRSVAACPARGRRGTRGFTLLELVLAVALIALLAGMVVVSLTGWRTRRQFDEGVRRFETVLRMARAEAAQRARKFRLEFDDESQACRIVWETDPLTSPGEWADFRASTWSGNLPNEWVRLVGCRLTGSSAYRLTDPAGGTGDDETTVAPLTFYTDGSCDSAVLLLAATDPEDPRQAIIELDGINGTITTRILDAEEADEAQEEFPRNM